MTTHTSPSSSGRTLSLPQQAAPAHRTDQAQTRLLQALLSEVEAISVFVAVSASIANAIAARVSPHLEIRSLDSYRPPEPMIYNAAALDLIEFDREGHIISAQQLMHARIALARRQSLTSALACPETSEAQRETLADAWQRACGAALGAAMTLRSGIAAGNPDHHARSRPFRISDMLRSAQRGDHPCVQPDGAIVIPGWAERRRIRRQPLSICATLERAGRTDEIRVADLSQGGLGFTGVADVVRGEPAVVVMSCGRRLAGTVAWTSSDRAGLKLGEPLAASDPLLRLED